MESIVTEEQASEILRGFVIPPQPQILVDIQIAQAIDSPDVNELAEMINKDIGIAGSIIKVVNSPYYGAQHITSVVQAIMMIGTKSIINIVNGLALRQESMTDNKISGNEVTFLNRFWDSAVDTAKAAALISKAIGIEEPNLLYSLGLFHNAGISIIFQRHPEYRKVAIGAYSMEGGSITEIENAKLKTNHAVLGYYLARSWKMPKVICDVIAQHHNVDSLKAKHLAKGGQGINMLVILKLAEHLVGLHYALGQHLEDLEWKIIKQDVCDYLNLSEGDIEDLAKDCEDIGVINHATT